MGVPLNAFAPSLFECLLHPWTENRLVYKYSEIEALVLSNYDVHYEKSLVGLFYRSVNCALSKKVLSKGQTMVVGIMFMFLGFILLII